MDTTLTTAQEFAQMEFGMADLGDKRRTRRLVQVGSALALCPSGTLPEAFDTWSELKGAYRFFKNPRVNYESIIRSHCEATVERCCQAGEYLLIEDGSCLDFSTRRGAKGLGRIGNDRGMGLMLHTALMLRVESWELDQTPHTRVEGIVGQSCWARAEGSARAKKERWRQRLNRPRESERWAEVLSQVGAVPPQAQWIYIADRESDIYEVFERCAEVRADFIIRAQFARALAQEDQSVFEAAKAAPILGRFTLRLRTRGDCVQRDAQMEVRGRKVVLRGVWRPGGERPDLEVTVVAVGEVDAPMGVEPVSWVLLTSLPCETFVQGRRIVARYARRWIIEEYHKALKSGANVEASQLESAGQLKSLLGVLAIVAVRLLNTKMLARSRPEESVSADTLSKEARAILEARFGRPKNGWNNASLIIAIARMGGFPARRADGLPGWLTIWRGWQRLMTMAEGVQTLTSSSSSMEDQQCG